MHMNQLHPVRWQILDDLRHRESARYSDLQKPSGLDSDVFKFHIKNLLANGWIQKNDTGEYALTAAGKEFANNLDDDRRTTKKQPKLSIIIHAKRTNSGREEFLFQKRQRNPYWGYWGHIGGAIPWGQEPEDVAASELLKQTGLKATLSLKAFYRQRDYAKGSGDLLEDKLFVIIDATDVQGVIQNDWPGGHSAWMTLSEVQAAEPYFLSIPHVIKMIQDGETYRSNRIDYASDQY
ncbi:MAG: putative hydrolase [Candidatus Saccharibacteria bacterium]|nr:putative hydrolase [Candidatus Saccharibacteria bacterium]